MLFKDFIKSLIPNPKDNAKEKMIKGCQVFFPDTLFFEKGKPSFLIQNDKDFCLAKVSEASDTNGKGLQMTELRRKLQDTTNSRKQKTAQHWLQLAYQARL